MWGGTALGNSQMSMAQGSTHALTTGDKVKESSRLNLSPALDLANTKQRCTPLNGNRGPAPGNGRDLFFLIARMRLVLSLRVVLSQMSLSTRIKRASSIS